MARKGRELDLDDDEPEEAAAEPIMDDWDIIKFDEDGILLALSLSDPISVSTADDQPDLLFI